MSRGFPSMTALLGMLAIAGYQNRDKIAELLRGSSPSSSGAGKGGLGELIANVRTSLGGASAGGILSTGLGELLDRFKQNGHGDKAQSWIATGPNEGCTAEELEKALGSDVLNTLVTQTGLPKQEVLSRLCRELPDAVDKYTPQGRLPTEAEFTRTS
jgi:uncharacterized protein YidB (DUF937 family)